MFRAALRFARVRWGEQLPTLPDAGRRSGEIPLEKFDKKIRTKKGPFIVFQVASTAAELPSLRFLLVSLAAHMAGIALLLTLQWPTHASEVRVQLPRAVLISPYLRPVSRPRLKGLVLNRNARHHNQNPRFALPPPRFSVPALLPRATEKIAIEIPDPPVLEAPRLTVPISETTRFHPPLPARMATTPAGFSGAEAGAPEPARRASLTTGSFDPASFESAPRRGVAVRADGFADATGASPVSAPRHAASASSGFGDSTAVTQAPVAHSPAAGPALAPVEILFKPRPAYTDEALRLKIEGEVLLEVLFEASGEVQVLHLLRGLGHGLDENANAAARQIRFRPAQGRGGPVDSSAVVHIVFQLAY